MAGRIVVYISTRSAEGRGYMGGIMAVDEHGLPLEFSYTSPPVRPTRLQRVLFGSSLEAHVRRDVVGAELLASLESRPDLIVVCDEVLLDLDPPGGCPVVWLHATRARPLGERGETQQVADGQHLIQLGEQGSPVRAVLAPGSRERLAEVRDLLLEVSERADVIEPTDRVAQAVELMWEADEAGGDGEQQKPAS
jgi:hypothetical protein